MKVLPPRALLFTVALLATSALTGLVASGPAVAAPVPGATYNGSASDGASITFTLSADGTAVISYEILGAHGTYQGMGNAITCDLVANDAPGYWPGAPITSNAFSYTVGVSGFSGAFNPDGSASGTFELDQPASGGWPDCNTGTVTWTATTTAASGGNPGGANPGASNTGGRGGSHKRQRVASRLTLVRLSGRTLHGRLTAANRNCLAGRAVYLWRGHRRIGRAHTSARGTYSFRISRAISGKRVRVTVTSKNLKLISCGAASSSRIA